MITPKQLKLLIFIAKHLTKHGFAPNHAEMAVGIGRKSKSNTHKTISYLRERGYIIRQDARARAIEITEAGWEIIRRRSKIAGRCPACNQPLTTTENENETDKI